MVCMSNSCAVDGGSGARRGEQRGAAVLRRLRDQPLLVSARSGAQRAATSVQTGRVVLLETAGRQRQTRWRTIERASRGEKGGA
jgi:hypothetical protein